jgi:hypothetical protein
MTDELKLLVINARLDGTLYANGSCPYGTTSCTESGEQVFFIESNSIPGRLLYFIPCMRHISCYIGYDRVGGVISKRRINESRKVQ